MITLTNARMSPNCPMRVSEAIINRWVKPNRLETASPRIDAAVMIPSPPTMTPSMITTCPNPDQYSPVLTTVSPVTQTAETAVKSAVRYGARSPLTVAIGNESIADATMHTTKNRMTANRAGEFRTNREMNSLNLPSKVVAATKWPTELTSLNCSLTESQLICRFGKSAGGHFATTRQKKRDKRDE
jgi:hypothetical protein